MSRAAREQCQKLRHTGAFGSGGNSERNCPVYVSKTPRHAGQAYSVMGSQRLSLAVQRGHGTVIIAAGWLRGARPAQSPTDR